MKIDLTFWLILALLTSVSANFLALYYIRTLLGKLFYVGENLSDLTQMITSYRNHIKSVYEMEMFYGDETLQHLMAHTRSLHEVLDEFEDIYEIAVPPDNTEETETNQEETQEDAPKTIDQENVFYAGTRTSNN
jgi:hypothetical protein